jgi:hypothetical protein
MLILHASIEDGFLNLWGETPPEQSSARPPFSPYDPGATALASAIGSLFAATLMRDAGKRTTFLPSGKDRPFPSTPLIADAPAGPMRLAPWNVTVLPLEETEMIALLTACQDKEAFTDYFSVSAGDNRADRTVRIGPSLVYWARVLRFAQALVARQQVVPTIAKDEGGWYALWQPVFVGEDAARFGALAKAMPAACRAQTEGTERPETPPAPALEALLTRLCDALMTPPAVAPKPGRKTITPKFDSLHDEWLHALQSPEGTLHGKEAELAEFARTIRAWQRPLSTSLAAPFRLCLRLESPDATQPDDTPWQVRYFLQSAADPSLLIPAESAWSGRGATAKLLTAPNFKTREFLLTALGEAARICPEIGESLKAATPAGYTLSLSGAHTFLTERAYLLEQAGFVVQLPSWWSRKTKPKVTGTVTAKSPKMQGGSGLSLDSIIQFDYGAAVGGEAISLAELERLAKLKQPLVRLRGQWVQLDADEIARAIAYWKKKDGKALTLRDLIRMQFGAMTGPGGIEVGEVHGEGPIAAILARLSGEQAIEPLPTPEGFVGTLRPYQERGYAWLRFLTDLGLGACLADDMGLGKSAQTIALLLGSRPEGENRPTLIVCPTSVVGNWQRELDRFAPSLTVLLHHGPDRLQGKALINHAGRNDILLTSYALLTRDNETLAKIPFAGVVLDEAQNIKNPETKQSKSARTLDTQWRVALSGTPVENHVGDLWSIFEFLNPGLLGTQTSFKKEFFTPIQIEQDEEAAARLKKRTGPLILRRLKTDKAVISDLPDKIEMDEFCSLTPEQASLYEAVLRDKTERLENAEGMEYRGVVLATLMKLKQVCNHPAQFLADGSPLPNRSGKLARLLELTGEIVEAGDRALIFSQFAEMGGMLQRHLRETLGREVLFLHGAVAKKERDALVTRFQMDSRAPLFVLSLKAGGVGLNLTAASHVIHFDRWWNPAVEDQATDRAFRIGQVKNVMVHKFLCRGTVEERIAEMIARKREVAGRVVGTGEQWLTELSTGELKNLFALSRERAVEEV